MKPQKTVLIALSGGVDSAVSAFLLKKQGYRVIAAFMKNFSETKNKLTGECSWISERRFAQRIAAILKIPLITLDFEKEYKEKVIEPMFRDYKKGLTPNPDILCNTIIKFPLLWKKAKSLRADYIATGHYARIKKTKKGFSLLSGKDKTKDQSYFIYQLTQKDLEHTLFPLGDFKKEQVRIIAKKLKFPNWNKQGTRGICFVGKIQMKPFLEQKIKPKKGLVISPEGRVLGHHEGIYYYTIGQRCGSHIGINIEEKFENGRTEKLYVAEKRKGNVLVVAPKNHPSLKKKFIILRSLHLINPKSPVPSSLKARIRHLGQFYTGRLVGNKFILNRPIDSVAEGQSLVLYSKSQVIGGGEIRLK